MDIGNNGIRLIHHFEGRTPFAYNDPIGHCTAGPGILIHRGKCQREDYAKYGDRVHPGISDLEYDHMFRRAIEPRERELERILGTKVMGRTTRHQFSAMLSLGWNVGMGALRDSSVVKWHKRRMYFLAGRSFLKFRFADGKEFAGLVRRRKAERWLYRHGTYKVDF